MTNDLTPIPGATPRYDDDGREIVDIATCGACGRSWNDAQSSSITPAPSGRCPFEYEHETPEARLEYLRGELRAQRISYGELSELQGLAEHIDPGDTELLEAAGIPEREDDSMDTFTLTIELGNDAMQTVADVVDALETVAIDVGRTMTAMSAQSGILRDDNGNTVGRWAVS